MALTVPTRRVAIGLGSLARSRPRQVTAVLGAAGVVALAGFGVLAGYRARSAASPPPMADTVYQAAPALAARWDPQRGAIRIVTNQAMVTDGEFEVQLRPPAGATQVQLALDPSFGAARWTEIPRSLTLTMPAPNQGYQILFGRFRQSDGSVSAPTVDGATVDATYPQAVASAAGHHQVSWVRPLSLTSLVVRVEAGRIQRGAQVSYDFENPEPGDQMVDRAGTVMLRRDEIVVGHQVPNRQDLMRTYDRLVGRPLDPLVLADGPWLVRSHHDQDFVDGQIPVDVKRISRPRGTGRGPEEELIAPMVHDIILTVATPIKPGVTYTIVPPPDLVDPVDFTVDHQSTPSPAILINQAGYGASDELKVAYLGGMTAAVGGVEYGELNFTVYQDDGPTVAYQGMARLRPAGNELGRGDLSGGAVYELDFSSLDRPGRYRLCVDSVGCSQPFEMVDNPWLGLVGQVARSAYHQRSGIVLGPPYTPVERPRAYHPDDGLEVHHSDQTLIGTYELKGGELFDQIAGRSSEDLVTEAWGGHFDAGDWDRRIQHLWFARSVLELVEIDPARYEGLDLNIPESGDQVPDLLNEALWTLDAFARLQQPGGAIRGGIEASEHPLVGTTSWTEPLAVYSYAPDPWSTYIYAGVAAQMAGVLAPYDPDRAAFYRQSGLRAMEWAEANRGEGGIDPGLEFMITEQRAVAAAALFKETAQRRWHEVFRSATNLTDGVDRFLACHARGHCDAAWIYLGTDENLTDPQLRQVAFDSMVATADEILDASATTSYGWTVEHPEVPLIWGLGVGGSPSAMALTRAHHLTGDDRYRQGALRSAAVSLGANPLGVSFITGVGTNPVRHPLIVDTIYGGLPVWPGTPIYGTHWLNSQGDESWVDEFVLAPPKTSPLAANVPYLWQWYDVSEVAMFGEFTIHQSHGEAIYSFGMLAASAP